MTLILSNDDVTRLVSMPDCIDTLERVYRELHAGRAVTRRRSDSITGTAGRPDAVYSFKTMDGVAPGLGFAAVRLNSDIVTWPRVAGNLRRVKVPAAPNQRWVGLILLFSTETGEPLAIMPDGVIQRMRVGATNGLGVKYMARESARTVGILGSGWQAGSQLMAVCAVRPIEIIRCYSPNPAHRVAFAQAMTDELGVEVVPESSADAVIGDVDIVMCASNTIEPIFFERWMTPGLHVSAIKMPEIEEAALRRADRVGVHIGQQSPEIVRAAGLDLPEQRAGQGYAANRIFDFDTCPRLPALIAGEAAGRASDDESTCFINDLGLGLQFAAVGGLAWRKAKDAGLGQELPTDWFTEDVHP